MIRNLQVVEAPGSARPRKDCRSLSQEAYFHIKRRILSGVFKDGEKIPEERIASLLKVSRTPIREALRRLAEDGLVEIKPRSYAKVASVTEAEAEQIVAIRVELEKLAARTLMPRADKRDIRALSSLVTKSVSRARAGRIGEAFEFDSAFHLEIIRRGGNVILLDIMQRLDAKNQLIRARSAAALPKEHFEECLSQHTAIVDSLASGDEDGLMRAVEAHIVSAERVFP